jgi:hypothetical protein
MQKLILLMWDINILLALLRIVPQQRNNVLNNNLEFHHLTRGNGLPNDKIKCIVQDDRGFCGLTLFMLHSLTRSATTA